MSRGNWLSHSESWAAPLTNDQAGASSVSEGMAH